MIGTSKYGNLLRELVYGVKNSTITEGRVEEIISHFDALTDTTRKVEGWMLDGDDDPHFSKVYTRMAEFMQGKAGMRLATPPLSIDGVNWNLVGTDEDGTLQVGMRASDGAILAGAGAVLLDASGLSGYNGETLQAQMRASDGAVIAGAGAVKLDANGLSGYNGSTLTAQIETDGDAAFGEDISAPASTSMRIFSNAQTYNSESVGSGDVLIGDNSSAKPNIFWDKSAGQLQFREGTNVVGKAGSGQLMSGIGVSLAITTTLTISNTTNTPVPFGAEVFDDASFHDNATNNTRVTIPHTGRYRISFYVYWDANTAGTRIAGIWINGSTVYNAPYAYMYPPSSAGISVQQGQWEQDLTANDYIELAVYQSSGGNLGISVCQLQVVRAR